MAPRTAGQIPVWDEGAILDALRAAADGGIAMSADAWRAGGLAPTPPVIIRHFGSWNAAVAAAGLRPRASSGGGVRMLFDRGSCVRAVALFLRDPDLSHFGAAAYDAWARGRDDVPSLATVRNRGPWAEIKRDAIALTT